jgi:hypothetical protein
MTLELYEAGSPTLIDAINLPPISYGMKSIMFMTECPVRLLVTDPEGLRRGFDFVSNCTVNEIYGSLYYYGDGSGPEIVWIPDPKAGNYSATVFGIESGMYNLTCATLDETGFLRIGKDVNVYVEKNGSSIHVIPEFPSFLMMLLVTMGTLLTLVFHKKKEARSRT